jgi:hypothetical protein
MSNLPSPPSFFTLKNRNEPSLVAQTTTSNEIMMSLRYISGIAIRVKRVADMKVNDPVKSKKCSVLLIKEGIKTIH